jgi:penicillin-binding protein A
MIRSLNRVTAVTLLLFLAVGFGLAYWSIVLSDSLLARADNPRRVEFEQALVRGRLLDRNGTVLAESVTGTLSPAGKPTVRRVYPVPAMTSAIGYYSLTYGVGGVEEAFDAILRGDDRLSVWDRTGDSILHRPQQGSDLRLTLDTALQEKLVEAFNTAASTGTLRGAAIVIDVPSGAVRALVSLPSFDPTRLNLYFATQPGTQRPDGAPLLNRVTQGIYQPGGALQPVILSALLSKGTKLENAANGIEPLTVNGLTFPCFNAATAASYLDALVLSCPRPFAEGVLLARNEVQAAFEAFGLTTRPTLTGVRTQYGGPFTPLYALSNDEQLLLKQGAGQGELVVTPLQMGLVAAAIANHGNSVTPFLAEAKRDPGGDWQPIAPNGQQTPVTSREIADSLRLAMRAAVQRGTAQNANIPGSEVFGHASFAYSGPQTRTGGVDSGRGVAWFIGFVDRPDGTSIAIAIVLEDTLDPALAAKIGGVAFGMVSG